jgi:two-component system NtrC family sensor kinase
MSHRCSISTGWAPQQFTVHQTGATPGVPVGAITVARRERGLFPERHVDLLRTLAHQAVIATENVRLFRELEARNIEMSHTLAREQATGEVLRTIMHAQTDAQPVFDFIAANALRLCRAGYGQVAVFDGEWLHLVALYNVNPEGIEALRQRFPVRLDSGTAMGRAVQARAVVSIPDVLEDPANTFKRELVTMGFQSIFGGADAPARRADGCDRGRTR